MSTPVHLIRNYDPWACQVSVWCTHSLPPGETRVFENEMASVTCLPCLRYAADWHEDFGCQCRAAIAEAEGRGQ